MNNKGYTLLELMMYMLVAIMIIGFTFQMISRTQKQYGQQRSMSKLQGAGRNSIYILAADIQNCGFKNYITDTTNDEFELIKIKGVTTGEDTIGTPETGLNAASSFYYYYSPGAAYDSIEFFKGEIKIGGTANDSAYLSSVLRIKYHMNGETLLRTQKVLDDQDTIYHWENKETIEIAENVEALKFEYSTDKITWNNAPGDKSEVKAIRISLLMRTNRTAPQGGLTDRYIIAGDTINVSGKYLRRLYSETVEVVNNGL